VPRSCNFIHHWSTKASTIIGASDETECDNFSKHSSPESHFVSNTPGHYGPTALIDTSRKIPQIQDPYVDAGIGGSCAAGPPFDLCNAEPNSDWLSQYDNAGIHLAQSALQTTTDTPTIGKTIGCNKPHVLDPLAIAGFGSSYVAGPSCDVFNADPSNLAAGSALLYNSSGFMPQSVGAEVHLAQFTFQAAPTASAPGEFTCSRCGKAFKRKGDLTRHGKSHGLTKLYCPYANCPRRVYTRGFHRKDKLVDHLEFSHKIKKEDARHWATSATIVCKW
jgi:uncharacterized C2H2 Zn-finger protein